VLGSVILCPITVIIVLIGYALKAFLGLDIDPSHRFTDFLR
jgi:hypothetical protein